MKRFSKIVATTIALLAAPLAVAYAENQTPAGAEVSGRYVARGVVSKVDTKTNEVSVKAQDGRELVYSVEPSTAQTLQPGDQIEVDVQMKVARPNK